VFDWAVKGKDVDMQKGHVNAVDQMLDLIDNKTKVLKRPFKFLDIGCGNGWVVRKVSKFKNCILAEGIDGAPEMIKKARTDDPENMYYLQNIEGWIPDKKYDIIFSMEVFYYFKEPEKIIFNLSKYIKKGGLLIIGVDHYKENTESLNWNKEYNISTNTFNIQSWKDFLIKADLDNIFSMQYGAKENWEGTLIVLGNKKT
jgi:2-polyprenyl-3-methyl-5-hydroxy-6-metoxy-1,4-benzoquinol methylase